MKQLLCLEKTKMMYMWRAHGVGERGRWRLALTVPVRHYSLNQGGRGVKWSDSEYMLKVELFTIWWIMDCERTRWRGKGDTEGFGLSNWKVRVCINWDAEDWKEQVQWARWRNQIWTYRADDVPIRSPSGDAEEGVKSKNPYKKSRDREEFHLELDIWEFLEDRQYLKRWDFVEVTKGGEKNRSHDWSLSYFNFKKQRSDGWWGEGKGLYVALAVCR